MPVDDYMIQELKNYFGQKFGPQKGYTTPTKFIFTSPEAGQLFAQRVDAFFGSEMPLRDRWNSPDGAFSKILGDRRLDPTVGAQYFAEHPAVPKRSLPPSPVSLTPPSAEDHFAMRTVGQSPPGNPAAATSHRVVYAGGKTIAVEMPPYALSLIHI